MKVLAGTSGFSYKEWVGRLIPRRRPRRPCSRTTRLAYRSSRSTTRSIGCRTPTRSARGALKSPRPFRFAIKAPRRITHVKRLKDCKGELGFLFAALEALEPCLGSILFQLPPFAKVDVAALSSFVEHLPPGCRAAFEFRNPSWLAARRLCRAEGAQSRAGPQRGRRTARGRPAVDRRLGVPPVAQGRLHPLRPRRVARAPTRRQTSPKPTSSSSTRTKRRARSSPNNSSASPPPSERFRAVVRDQSKCVASRLSTPVDVEGAPETVAAQGCAAPSPRDGLPACLGSAPRQPPAAASAKRHPYSRSRVSARNREKWRSAACSSPAC